MVQHYLKIAFRNLLKYKTQTLISIIGLAIGYTCFALANMWIHYEMTFDSDYDGTDRMYILYKKNVMSDTGYNTNMPYPASTILKEEFPEVEAASAYSRWNDFELKVDGKSVVKTHVMQSDSCLMNMFDISVISGSMDFLYSDEKIALTEEMASLLFDTPEKALGEKVTINNDEKRTVCAIIKGLEHSNLSFGYWGEGAYFRGFQNDWMNIGFRIIIKLRKGIDPNAFQAKLNTFNKKADSRDPVSVFEGVQLMPLTQYHYSTINEEKSIKFYYLILFSVAGGLVILCSLFNYISLFITRINMRDKELKLRKVCGSSITSMFLLLTTEYLMIISISGLLGMTLVELFLPVFRDLSGISGNIYGESLLFFIVIIAFSFIMVLPFIFRLTPAKKNSNRFLFRKCSIIFQLIIGILFIFCMTVILKQIYFLTNTDLGWERRNIATIARIYPGDSFDEIADKTAQLPCTQEVLKGHWGLLPRGASLSLHLEKWDEKQDSVKGCSILALGESEELARFYRLKLIAGEMLKKEDNNKTMINESAAKALGMSNPIGKNIYLNHDKAVTIIGLIKDFHTTPPTIPVQPTMFIGEHGINGFSLGGGEILIKFHEGKWNDLKSGVDSMFSKSYPNTKYKLFKVEDVYAEYLKSETTLLKLLSFVSIVCILISAFGIFSLVTLSCEQRRKEIAIRKVNGATIKDILIIFIKEYVMFLIIASVIAFPIGYILMKQWLESYVEQTFISPWIYIAIFTGIAFVIAICIGWRVWQAAKQNPAKTIKTE